MSNFKFECGERLKDEVTGFTGIVESRSEYLSGINRYTLRPTSLKNGEVQKSSNFDESSLKVVKGKTIKTEVLDFKFKCGDMVKDSITSYQGVVVSQGQFQTGCNRVAIQKTKLNKEGKPENWQWFDEELIILVKSKSESKKDKPKRVEQKRGGPKPDCERNVDVPRG